MIQAGSCRQFHSWGADKMSNSTQKLESIKLQISLILSCFVGLSHILIMSCLTLTQAIFKFRPDFFGDIYQSGFFRL